MKKQRLIPVVLLKDGFLVQSKGFSKYQNLGNPMTTIKRLSQWGADELIYLDISKGDNYDLRRDDQGYNNHHSFLDIIEEVSKVSFMPITVGGKIKTLKDIENRLSRGADKISINTAAVKDPKFIEEAAKEFGSQCIVISIDAKLIENKHFVFIDSGKINSNYTVQKFARKVSDLGAGEILINSINRDGSGDGYDLELINKVCETVDIPVIACGGAGDWEDFADVFDETGADAVAAANIFHYRDQSVFLAKKFLHDNNYNIRKPEILKI